MVYLLGSFKLAIELKTNHTRELLWKCITNNRNHTNSTTSYHWEGEGIITTDNLKIVWFVLDNLVNLLK